MSFAIAGCATAPNQPVQSSASLANVFSDTNAYAEQAFSLGALPASVRDTLNANDVATSELSFHRITIQARSKWFKMGTDAPQNFTEHVTYDNLGKGVIRAISTDFSNGFTYRTEISLTYRNYVGLMMQKFASSATAMPAVSAVLQFDRFEPALSSDKLAYTMRSGYIGKPGLTQPWQIVCQLGRSYSGTVVNAHIAGNVREMSCQSVNANGVTTEVRDYVYLQQYGLALTRAVKSASSDYTVDLVDFKAE
ncbi:hypothetical protein DWU98_07740 [Dyella monticola]|uniref:Uncharacterized protein n=1 Tax=Dyella monticola TaxID=1927958 RepID=A0A370X3L9_9GAMM|nr:hypothetical protein [Dyella monticola]RDS83014.1 hypothetical protein DWU98_07740 [Dyella monticola]